MAPSMSPRWPFVTPRLKSAIHRLVGPRIGEFDHRSEVGDCPVDVAALALRDAAIARKKKA
jgi:hypothetical protein